MEKDKQTATGHTFDGGVTPEQEAQFKAKYGKVSRIDVVDGEDTHIGYFKRPDFPTMRAVTHLAKTDEIKAGEAMFDNCFIGGSPELRKDALLFMAVQKQLGTMLSGCMGSLKNL